MKASIITIGDEILIGQITDSNSGFIAKALDSIGVEVTEMLSIADSRKQILDALAYFQDKVDIVIITGGLGPTKDDITKKTLCDYFKDTLISDPAVLAHVKQLIEKYTKKSITQLNIDQATVPSMATVLFNRYGTAPGMWMKHGNTVFVSLPGVPFEMKHLIVDTVLPKIVKEYSRPYIIHKTILTYGQGESLVAERIENWESLLPGNIKLAYLPSPGRVRLRLSARGTDKAALVLAIDEQVTALALLIGDIIVGFDENETIEHVLGKLLTKKKLTLATAESCTGGKIAQLITSIPGSSTYYKGSVVCYTKEVKIDVLGVSAETIKTYSVVSEQVAREMAVAATKLIKADYAIGVTGNAGPTKDDGTSDDAGIVFISIATPYNVICERFDFGQPREKVIDRAANKSLELLQKEILKNVL